LTQRIVLKNIEEKMKTKEFIGKVLDYTPFVGFCRKPNVRNFLISASVFLPLYFNALISFSSQSPPSSTQQEINSAYFARQERVARKNLIKTLGEKYDFDRDGKLSDAELDLARENITGIKNTRGFEDAARDFSTPELIYFLEKTQNDR